MQNRELLDRLNGGRLDLGPMKHEELVRRWDRLKQWINEDRRFLQWRASLAPLLEQNRRDRQFALLRGKALHESKKFYPYRERELEDREREFLRSSFAAERKRRYWCGAAVSIVVLLVAIGFVTQLQMISMSLVERLVRNDVREVPGILDEIEGYRWWVHKRIRHRHDESPLGSSERLRLALALMPKDKGYIPGVQVALLDAEPRELKVICDRLDLAGAGSPDSFWIALEDENETPNRRLNGACALARLVAKEERQRWNVVAPYVTQQCYHERPQDSWVALTKHPSGPACGESCSHQKERRSKNCRYLVIP